MSLPVVDRSEIPAETARLGRELMAADNLYRQLGDKLANLIKDEGFAWMYSRLGGPGISPVILALVTVLHMLEKLPDRLAADMVRMRIGLTQLSQKTGLVCHFEERSDEKSPECWVKTSL